MRRLRLAVVAVVWGLVVLYVGAGFALARTRGRLPALPHATPVSRIDADLSDAAAALSGGSTVVYCWSRGDWNRRTSLGPWRGETLSDPRVIWFSPEMCEELTALREDHLPVWESSSPDALAWAASGLAHESAHVAGWFDEAVAECYGMQSIRRAALLLGRTREEGEYLTRRYWTRFYPWDPPRYRSRECRNGGRLDLRPRTDVFP